MASAVSVMTGGFGPGQLPNTCRNSSSPNDALQSFTTLSTSNDAAMTSQLKGMSPGIYSPAEPIYLNL